MPTYVAEKQVRFGQLQSILEANATKGWELVTVTAENEFYTTVWKVPLERHEQWVAEGISHGDVVPAHDEAVPAERSFVQPSNEQQFVNHASDQMNPEALLSVIKQAIRDELSRLEVRVALRTR